MIKSTISTNKPGKRIEEFVFTKLLGKGAFGEVFEAIDTIQNISVAVKCVPKTKLKEHNGLIGKLLESEVSVLQQCNNQNIVHLIRYCESVNQCYIIMEFCNQGEFEQLWRQKGKKINEREAIGYLKQILNGMKALHELNVIHRDLKLPNILIHDGVLKIADLGFAKQLSHAVSLNNLNQFLSIKDAKDNLSLGSLGNMAPEVIEQKPYGMLADMFSIGAIYYQMLFGTFPFSVQSHKSFLRDIQTNPPNLFREGVQISAESRQLLQRMLEYQPTKRMKWTELYNHPLITESGNGSRNIRLWIIINQDMLKQVSVIQLQDKSMLRKMLNSMKKKIKTNNQNYDDLIKLNQQNNKDAKIVHEEDSQDKEYVQSFNQDSLSNEDKNKEIIQKYENQKKVEQEVNFVIEEYFAQRNKLIFLGRTLDAIHTVKHDKPIDGIFPAFLLGKRLMREIEKQLQAISQKENIFKTNLIDKVYENKMFQINFYQSLIEDSVLYRDTFELLLFQAQQSKEKIPDMELVHKNEICENDTQYSKQVYEQELLGYLLKMQTVKDKEKVTNEKNKILDLIINLIECIQLNRKQYTKIEITKMLEQADKLQDMDIQSKEKLIESMFNYLF